MARNTAVAVAAWIVLFVPPLSRGAERPLQQEWAYADAMRAVAARGNARGGVVIHIGDSITYANPYGAWARYGKGHDEGDNAALKWMHTGAGDDTDGWYLAAFDHPDGGRSYTACGGIRIDEMLAGGKQRMPPLKDLLERYNPQAVVLMLGTNDASAGRPVAAYRHDMEAAVDLMLSRGIVPILSTIPPHIGRQELARSYNDALREIGKAHQLPLIDFEREILRRRSDDWDGTLLNKGDVHPTAARAGADQSAEPTAENLRNSGYLLRGWLSVKKIEEVKAMVFDGARVATPPASASSDARDAAPARVPPAGEAVRVPVTRDTWFSAMSGEADGNTGGASQLKLKSIQEMSLIDIDPAPLRGRVITGAVLHLHHTGNEILHRVTVSSFASEWVEGTGEGYAKQPGSSAFNWQQYPATPWAFPGSDLTAVMLGQGGTIWRMADASAPDGQGWQEIPVDPAVVGARVAGVSHGFLLFDDTGSEWTRQGERFTMRMFPNRFVHSRESRERTAPYLTVYLGDRDADPPAAPTRLRSDAADLPAGEARVSWLTPADAGPAGTIGFLVQVNGKSAPGYLIPAAGKPGQRVTMHLRDLGLKGDENVNLSIRAVDGAGNIGPPASLAVKTSAEIATPLAGEMPEPFKSTGALPKLGAAEVAVIDALDKVQPVTGAMVPAQEPGYLAANHLWDAHGKRIRLHAAKNEFVSFQVLLRGKVQNVKAKLEFAGGASAPAAEFFRFRYISSQAGPMPDPLLPLGEGLSVPAADQRIEGQQSGSLLCEAYVPHESVAGERQGTLTLTSGAEELKLDVSLTVWDFTLPDFLSFIPEMNSYGLPDNERAYYRLAHRNRTVINRVPYHQSGDVAAGCAPAWNGRKLDFTAWDKRFGPYLDGSAFADLPRKGVPLDCFYLPLNENWPSPMESNYNGDYWADRAFPPTYREAFVNASRQFAEHCNAMHWDRTLFHCFFNGKNNYKQKGWSRGSSPWLLDEPANFQDYWALRWFGMAFHEGVDAVAGDAKMMFRCDISRPEWQRDAFDEVLDYNVVAGGAFKRYRRYVMDRKHDLGQVVIAYGGTNDLHQSNMQPVGWSLDAWTQGADGILPWQTIGTDESWLKADSLSLFYPGEPAGLVDPVPSVRLKAFLRGEQDVEYLVLLAKTTGASQLALGRRVHQTISLNGVRKGTRFEGEDAGMIDFDALRPQDVWALRVRVGGLLSAAKPPAERRVVDLRTPKRDLGRANPGYVSGHGSGIAR